jgi:hypothetical protein
MYRSNDLGLVYGPYGGLGYFERGDLKAVVTSFRWRRFLKYLCSLL